MTSKNYGNYQQSNVSAYKSQFDGTVAKGGEAKANTALAKQIGQQISTAADRLQIDKATVQQNIARGNSVDLPRSESAYAADIATLHNLERQYAAATGDADNLSRLRNNSDQTGLGTTNDLLAQAGARNAQGAPATDKDFTFTGAGSEDGANARVTAQLKGGPTNAQGTAAFLGTSVLEGSSSGPHAPPVWWGNGSARTGGEG